MSPAQATVCLLLLAVVAKLLATNELRPEVRANKESSGGLDVLRPIANCQRARVRLINFVKAKY